MRSPLALALAAAALAVGARCETTLIKGGTVVSADGTTVADVLLRDGKVAAVGPALTPPSGATIVDASNLLVAPGGVDAHTHLDAPFTPTLTTVDDYFTGCRAALAGGTTTLLDFALPTPTVAAGFARHAAGVDRDAACDVALHMALNKWDDQVRADLERLVENEGVASFKMFFSYKGPPEQGGLAIDDEGFLAALTTAKRLGAVTMIHAENADAVEWARAATFARGVTGPEGHQLSRPAALEDQGTQRALTLAGLVAAPLYVVHVMSAGAAALIAAAREAGQPVYGETVVSAFAADPFGPWRANYAQAAAHLMSPPIRSPMHQAGIVKQLVSGGLSGVGTDHAVWSTAHKSTPAARADFRAIPNGVNGVQERMIATYDALVVKAGAPLEKWVQVTATAPALAFGLHPQKGALLPGSDADVVLIDPRATTTVSAATHASAVDINIYEGRKFAGRIVGVWARGVRVVDDNGAVTATRGAGRRLRLRPFGSELWGRVAGWEGEERWKDEFPKGRGPVDRSSGGLPWWQRVFGGGKDEL